MELKEFVKATLIQIVEGVREAQGEGLDLGAIISPADNMERFVRYNGMEYNISNIDFEVTLTGVEGSQSKTGIGVFLGSIGVGGQSKLGTESASLSRVKFSVPVGLPPIETYKPKKIKAVATPTGVR